MDDLFKIDMSFPVPGFSCLPFIKLLPIAIGTEQRLLKVCASVADKNLHSHNAVSLMLGVTHQAFYNFTPLIAAGA